MPRSARIVIPGIPHHVTQRGNRRLPVFFRDDDYQLYMKLLRHFAARNHAAVLGWCLMPNHIHLILVPSDEDGLRATVAPLHRTYAEEINRREGWNGHLWQERYVSFPLDDAHTIAALRYIDLNPVRAGLADNPTDYRWSSARAHLEARSDGIVDTETTKRLNIDWLGLYASGMTEEELESFRVHEKNNLPLGSGEFIDRLETKFSRPLRPQRSGRKRKK